EVGRLGLLVLDPRPGALGDVIERSTRTEGHELACRADARLNVPGDAAPPRGVVDLRDGALLDVLVGEDPAALDVADELLVASLEVPHARVALVELFGEPQLIVLDVEVPHAAGAVSIDREGKFSWFGDPQAQAIDHVAVERGL